MEKKRLRLRIITPRTVKVDEEVDMVIMRSTQGDMGILPRHAPQSAVLSDGVLRLINGDDERRIAVFGGMAQVQRDVVTILTGDAQWPEDIDRARAEADRDQAERYLRENADDLELQSTQVRLRRSLVRIEVSAYPLVSGTKTTE